MDNRTNRQKNIWSSRIQGVGGMGGIEIPLIDGGRAQIEGSAGGPYHNGHPRYRVWRINGIGPIPYRQ